MSNRYKLCFVEYIEAVDPENGEKDHSRETIIAIGSLKELEDMKLRLHPTIFGEAELVGDFAFVIRPLNKVKFIYKFHFVPKPDFQVSGEYLLKKSKLYGIDNNAYDFPIIEKLEFGYEIVVSATSFGEAREIAFRYLHAIK